MNYFIDTNLIIDAFERKNTESQNKLKTILEDDNNRHLAKLKKIKWFNSVKQLTLIDYNYQWIEFCKKSNEIFYNGLVYTEALRAVLNDDLFTTLKSSFAFFTWIDIDQSIYIKTKKFSRYCRSKGLKVAKGKCELIDMIHFITAKHNNLEIITNDTDDFKKLEQAYQDFISEDI